MGGVSMDLWKYYDPIDVPTAIEFLEQLGLDCTQHRVRGRRRGRGGGGAAGRCVGIRNHVTA